MAKKRRTNSHPTTAPVKSAVTKAAPTVSRKFPLPMPVLIGLGILVLLLLGALWACTPPAAEPQATPTVALEAQRPTPTSEAVPPASGEMPTDPLARNDMYQAPPAMEIDPAKTYIATIETDKGNIVVELNAQAAPQTVNNFVFLSRQGFYNGLTFHRVEPGFVIQGGDPLGQGMGGPGYTVPAEIGLPHDEGVIATARQGDQVNPTRASSGSQFYITLAPVPQLDGGYTVFGKVTSGMDIVQSIAIGDVIKTITITEQ